MTDERARSDGSDGSPGDFVRELVAASRAEAPRAGAKARAIGAVLPELSATRAVEAEARRPRSRWLGAMAAASGAMLIITVVGSGLFIKHQHDVAAAEEAEAAAELAAQKALNDRLVAELRAQTSSVAALQGAVDNAKDDAARAMAIAQLDEAKRQAESMAARLSGARPAAGAGSGARPASRPACNCTPGDPLCSCIP